MKGNAEFNQHFFFGRKLFIFKSATKIVAYLKGLGRDLKIFFFLTFKRLFEIKLVILLSWFRLGSETALIKFCGSGSAFDQCGSTPQFFLRVLYVVAAVFIRK